MDDIKQSIVKTLDGTDDQLLPHLPYLLQDLWEIGSSPEIIIQLLKKYECLNNQSKVLDLGCGKGAVSINLAKEFGCLVHGIDAMPEFIDEAKSWAQKFKVNKLCTFEVGNIRQRINDLRNFDLVILGSIGPVLGNIESTIKSIQQCIPENGFVILDDGVLPDNSTFQNENYLTQSEAEKQIKSNGMQIIEPFILDENIIAESDADIYKKIEIRAFELMNQFPDKREIFEEYLRIQRFENDILENQIKCVTWLLKKSN